MCVLGEIAVISGVPHIAVRVDSIFGCVTMTYAYLGYTGILGTGDPPKHRPMKIECFRVRYVGSCLRAYLFLERV